METGLTTYQAATPAAMTLQETLSLGEVLAKSGMFSDVRSAAQAVVKILVGRELGFGPMASLIDVHIIEGKPSVGAHLRASVIKASGKYDYRVVECSKERCELEFLELKVKKWEAVGKVSMTLKEATDSGLAVAKDGRSLKTNWQRSPDDMLFARCVSKGYRRYCPDLSGGVLAYDPDEMDSSETGVSSRLVEVPNTSQPTVPLLAQPTSTAAVGAEPGSSLADATGGTTQATGPGDGQTEGAKTLTDSQAEEIDALSVGIPQEKWKKRLRDLFGTEDARTLNPAQAEELIALLKAKKTKKITSPIT